MTAVMTLLGVFAFSFLMYKWLYERIVFFMHSNFKYKILDALADFIHYGRDIGVEATLKLDWPSSELYAKRLRGQIYLKGRIDSVSLTESEGENLGNKIVDCRFSLHKVIMPLLRELEFSAKDRNFIRQVHIKSGMHRVELENGQIVPYLGGDAVHTFGYESFFKPVQAEINKRMASSESLLRFAPTSLNPELKKNTQMMLDMTGMDQIRYSLSGSEAMDCALKDIKASCRGKKVIVRFRSAYHGHVSGVDFLNCDDHIFLKEGATSSLELIEKFHYRIAAVIVNPMQHFTGINKPSPAGEKLNMGKRDRTAISKDKYAKWLHALQAKCNYCTKYLTKVAFVIDDIYFAFRTPDAFSSHYFLHPETGEKLKPDVMLVAKGVAAGYPVSMVLGRRGFLLSYDKKYLLQINKSVGTLAGWYGGLVASNVFLDAWNGTLKSVKINPKEQLKKMISKFDQFSAELNELMESKALPVRLRNFSNTFSVNYLSDSIYNSRFPQYLLAEGIFLGNYSTGKWNMNDDTTPADLDEIKAKFVAAAEKMYDHGYFTRGARSKAVLLLGLAFRFLLNYTRVFFHRIMEDKDIDIQVSHNHPVNKFVHFWSSVIMLAFAYPSMLCGQTLKAGILFFAAHVIRQSGHFFYEHQDRDIEKLKFGHKDGSKKLAAGGLIFAGVGYYYRAIISETFHTHKLYLPLNTEQYVILVASMTILVHFLEIVHQYGLLRGISWQLKIWTDPITDLMDFYHYAAIKPKWFFAFKDQNAIYELDPKTKAVRKVEMGNENRGTSKKLFGVKP